MTLLALWGAVSLGVLIGAWWASRRKDDAEAKAARRAYVESLWTWTETTTTTTVRPRILSRRPSRILSDAESDQVLRMVSKPLPGYVPEDPE